MRYKGGLAPTQVHGLDMPPHTEWDFVQILGVTDADPERAYAESWDNARDYVQERLDTNLREEEVDRVYRKLQTHASKDPEVSLHDGSGWGALERLRREQEKDRPVPAGFAFADRTLGVPQYPWLALLQQGALPDGDVRDIPASWMVQDEWLDKVRESLKQEENQTWTVWMHYGVMLYERGLEAEAMEAWESSLQAKPSAWVYRNLAQLMIQRDQPERAMSYYESAYSIDNGFPDKAFAEEYLQLLTQCKKYEKAWVVYEALPADFAASDRIRIIVGAAALALDKEAFLDHLFAAEFAVIREGETLIVDLWYQYNARKMAQARNIELTPELMEEVTRNCPPPRNIDFRLIEAITHS
ncbi:hypothetical protein OMP38_03780 [Cohnella ginsengisoli]|uniref:Tetratricopeptide repeat protein n=1 Tax=Cohnella ginsengisoli TaxID=425004 RepID=A0A9X4QKW5_9BACL|nr:tetratricopeptide repeat protein [Cohnella ginsengisoli]MDG0790069.1 hypothetical protein [Cohnella ginsengisoli]